MESEGILRDDEENEETRQRGNVGENVKRNRSYKERIGCRRQAKGGIPVHDIHGRKE